MNFKLNQTENSGPINNKKTKMIQFVYLKFVHACCVKSVLMIILKHPYKNQPHLFTPA